MTSRTASRQVLVPDRPPHPHASRMATAALMPLILFAPPRRKAVVSLVTQAPSLACTLLFARHAPAGLGLNRKAGRRTAEHRLLLTAWSGAEPDPAQRHSDRFRVGGIDGRPRFRFNRSGNRYRPGRQFYYAWTWRRAAGCLAAHVTAFSQPAGHSHAGPCIWPGSKKT